MNGNTISTAKVPKPARSSPKRRSSNTGRSSDNDWRSTPIEVAADGLEGTLCARLILRQKLPHIPNPIRDPCRHCRGYAQRFVNPAEVVERIPERHRGPVV